MTAATSTHPPEAPVAGLPTRAMVLLTIATFSATANLRVSDSLLPQVAAEFGTSVGSAAMIVTAFALAFGCCQLFYGTLGDRLGKYRVIMAVCFLSALGTGACAFMPTLETLAAGRFLSGVVSAAIVPLGMAWIGDVVPYERRQGILARFLTGQILGMVFGQVAGGILGDLIGWRSVYLVLGAVHLAGGIGLLIEVVRNPGLHAPAAAGGASAGMSMAAQFRSVLRRPWARIVLIGVFAEGLVMFGAVAYIGADLHQRFRLGYTSVGLVLAAYGLGGIVYAWSARALIARLGERGLVTLGAFLATVGYVALAIAPATLAAWVAILTLGFGYWMLHNTFQTNATQMAPEARGVAMSLFASAFFMGQSIGVALAAQLFDGRGAGPVYVLAALGLALVGLWFRGRLAHKP